MQTPLFIPAFRDEPVTGSFVIAVFESTVISVIISVFHPSLLFFIFTIGVIDDMVITVAIFQQQHLHYCQSYLHQFILIAVIISNIRGCYHTLAVFIGNFIILHTNFISSNPMIGVVLELIIQHDNVLSVARYTIKTKTNC